MRTSILRRAFAAALTATMFAAGGALVAPTGANAASTADATWLAQITKWRKAVADGDSDAPLPAPPKLANTMTMTTAEMANQSFHRLMKRISVSPL